MSKSDCGALLNERITPVRCALISVFDKEGIVDLARELCRADVVLVSTGGTARLLEEAGLPLTRVADLTGFPEMLDGRLKTLHPKVHGGILAKRGNPDHEHDLASQGIGFIDLVIANLYPFEETARMEGIGFQEIVEMIDIGGPTMVRAAAKNFRDVGVVVDPSDYRRTVDEILGQGGLTNETRFELARKAFRHTSSYDTAIFSFLDQLDADLERRKNDTRFPQKIELDLVKINEMRYGENPHQRAALYTEPQGNAPTVVGAEQLQGSELSFNNVLDLDAAAAIVGSLTECGCAVIKHGNPCGAAIGQDPRDAFEKAREGDPVSAFGGIVAFNRVVSEDAATALKSLFLEAVIAPGFSEAARDVLAKKKKLRLLAWGDAPRIARPGFDVRRVSGGYLIQEWDRDDDIGTAKAVTERAPDESEWNALRFAWSICRHVRSNAIVLARTDRTVGIGAGQMSRVDAVTIATMKAGESSRGSVLASDAFFPFRDGIDAAAKCGITALIQPGGSIRDEEVIAAANEHGMAMVSTGTRHFRH